MRKSTSTDSRYSPKRSAMAVPPPNRQPRSRRSEPSSASSTCAMRRWCGRSNNGVVSNRESQGVDEFTFSRRERRWIEVPPVALVDAQGFARREFLRAVNLPGQFFQPRIVGDADAGG